MTLKERILIEFKENSMLAKFYLWFYKKQNKNERRLNK